MLGDFQPQFRSQLTLLLLLLLCYSNCVWPSNTHYRRASKRVETSHVTMYGEAALTIVIHIHVVQLGISQYFSYITNPHLRKHERMIH